MARQGRIIYQVGIGVASKRTVRQITLFGTWKFSRDLAIAFEMPMANGEIVALRFEGTVIAMTRNRVTVALLTTRRRPLGLQVTFTRDMAPDLQAFIDARYQGAETAVIGGLRGRF